MGSSNSKEWSAQLPAIDNPIKDIRKDGAGIPSPHYTPEGFRKNAFQSAYVKVLQCLYYGQRQEGIPLADWFLQVTQQQSPQEHACAVVLRCLFDLHEDIKVEPSSITNRRRLNMLSYGTFIADVADQIYHTYGSHVVTAAAKRNLGSKHKPKLPIEDFFATFMPKLISAYEDCDPDTSKADKNAIFSDMQVFFYMFYNKILMDDEIWMAEGNSLMTGAVMARRRRTGKNLSIVCKHLRAKRRVDLALYFIQNFAKTSGVLHQTFPDPEYKRLIAAELVSLGPFVKTQHQGAVFRYLAYRTINEYPMPALIELPMLCRVFIDCKDKVMELEVSYADAMAPHRTYSSARLPQLRKVLQRAADIGQISYVGLILKSIILDLAAAPWSSVNHCTETLQLLVDYEFIEEARLGSSLHSDKGSISIIYELLWRLLRAGGKCPNDTQQIISLYAENLMRRYPPRSHIGAELYEKISDVQLLWFQKWGLDMDSEDCEIYSRQLREWVSLVEPKHFLRSAARAAQAEAPQPEPKKGMAWTSTKRRASLYARAEAPGSNPVDHYSPPEEALAYASWLFQAGSRSLDEERGLRLLDEVETYLRGFAELFLADSKPLLAVRAYKIHLDIIRQHPKHSQMRIDDCQPLQDAVRCCETRFRDYSDGQAEALDIIRTARYEFFQAVPLRDGKWHATVATDVQSRLTPEQITSRQEAKRVGRQFVNDAKKFLESITVNDEARRRQAIVRLSEPAEQTGQIDFDPGDSKPVAVVF